MGAKVQLCPTFDSDMIMRNLGKFTISFAAPHNYRYIRDNFNKLSAKTKEAIYKTDCFVSGGDKISAEENKDFDELFRVPLINGYGNNEGWEALTVNPVNHNKYGTVGIAKYGETIIAYDNDSKKELPYGENGEICALADTMFLYYESNEEETNSVKRMHSDGKIWLHTGDLGNVDNEGFITLGGRARRVIVRQGFKISAYTIEDKITEHSAVKECVAVEVKDVIEEHVPMAYIIPKDTTVNEETIIQSVLDKCRSELKEYEIPKYFRIVTELPYTQNNKYDFRLLEQQGNEYVDSLNN
jgi:long-chain acyl-CoA synthetase